MDWGFLSFLGEPGFVLPWYVVGALGAAFVIHDTRTANTPLKPAMRWAWPIIVLFFSVVGLALYLATARAPGIGRKGSEEEKGKAHEAFERPMWRRVNGASSHCVAGDGFGIMSAMVIARAGGMSFWQEFWWEYLVGFVIGWLVFQRKSMTMMTDSLARQLAMAFRAEFFSMLTVMGGMGAVMTFVTPLVATAQPKPLTWAFWGFGMLGLLVGYVLTFPMNWMMVKVGWKHGMGGMEAAREHEARTPGGKAGLVAAMVALGCAALVFPAWLTVEREARSLEIAPVARAGAGSGGGLGSGGIAGPADPGPGAALARGLRATLGRAVDGLRSGRRTEASVAMDAALRAAEVGANSAPGSFYAALEEVRYARGFLQQGSVAEAVRHLEAASRVVEPARRTTPAVLDLRRYVGARVVDAGGALVGEVTGVSGDAIRIALGGWRDAWGFVDFGADRVVTVPVGALAFGPPRKIGTTLVALPGGAARPSTGSG